MRKFWGILLIIIGVLFVFAAIGQIVSIISTILGVLKIFNSGNDAYETGYILGGLVYWIIHFLVIYFSFKYGIRLTRRKKTNIP